MAGIVSQLSGGFSGAATGGTPLIPGAQFAQKFAPAKTNIASQTPAKAARRQTALNQRIEALLAGADDIAQGQGLGLDTLLAQQFQDLITGQQSPLTRQRIADVSGQLGNTLSLARQELASRAASAGLGRSASPLQTEGALISRIAAERARQESDIIDRQRQQAANLLNAILQSRAQRAQILSGFNFPGVQKRSALGEIGSVIGGAGQLAGGIAKIAAL